MIQFSNASSEVTIKLKGKKPQKWTECRFTGNIEASTIHMFQEAFEELLKEKKYKVILNLSGVVYITSTGLGGLVKYFNLFSEKGGYLVLTNVSDPVMNVIQMLELQVIVPIYKNVDDLCENFTGKMEEVEEETKIEHLAVVNSQVSDRKTKVALEQVEKREIVPVVLAVAEEDFISRLSKDILEKEKIKIFIATNAKDAFDFIEKEKAVAIIVDYLLPKYDSLCAKIKMTPETSGCSIIRLCKEKTSPRGIQRLNVMPNEHVVEPCTLSNLCSIVKSEVKRHRELTEAIEHELHVCFPSSLEYIDKANKLMEKVLLKPLGQNKKHYLAVRSSLREAIDNANRHGNKEDAAKMIEISYLLDTNKITMSVRDDGLGFDSRKVIRSIKGKTAANLAEKRSFDSLGGLGISLMLKCSDKLSYNKKGNEVTQVMYLNQGMR
ncbi:MAG: anti-sigma factor antagonist [Desulfamplus sp.]|nr:anti-sigma factor antagonist [Desulfamplus sp.]